MTSWYGPRAIAGLAYLAEVHGASIPRLTASCSWKSRSSRGTRPEWARTR